MSQRIGALYREDKPLESACNFLFSIAELWDAADRHMETQGIYSAVWVPTSRNGDVHWAALDQQLTFVTTHGVDGIMALGTTGNFNFFDLEKRKAILEHVAQHCRQGTLTVPIIANVSDISIRNVLRLVEHAAAAGAAAVAVLPPWYYSMEQRDLAEYFIEVGRASSLPVALYNYPEVTGKRIELDTFRRVAEKIPLHSFKQSGGEFKEHEFLLPVARSLGVPVLTGWDTRLPEAYALGVKGSISGLSNAVPDLLAKIWASLRAGDAKPAEAEVMAELGRMMSFLPFPHNVRAAIAARGIDTGELINPVSPETNAEYNRLVAKIQELYRSAKLV